VQVCTLNCYVAMPMLCEHFILNFSSINKIHQTVVCGVFSIFFLNIHIFFNFLFLEIEIVDP
jgi:hypothetical protein